MGVSTVGGLASSAVPYGSGKASAVDAWGRGLCLAAQCPDRPRGGGKHKARRADPSVAPSITVIQCAGSVIASP